MTSLRPAAASLAAGGLLQATIAVSGIVSARVLGVEDRGRLALLWVVTVVASQVATAGLQSAVSYAIAEGEDRGVVAHRLQRLVAGQLVAAPILVAVVVVAVAHGSRSTLEAALPMLAAAPGFVLLAYGIAIAQGDRRYRAVQFHRLFEPILFALILVGFAVAKEGDLLTISAAWAATMVICGLAAWRHALGRWWPGSPPAPRPDARSASWLARFGRRSFLGTFGTTEHMMVDQILVGVLLSPLGFGLYVAANAFSNLPRFLGQSVGLVAYPEVVAATGESRGRALGRYALVALVATLPVVVVLFASMEWLLPLLFGEAFSDAVPVARILLVAALLQSMRRAVTEGARGLGSGLPGAVGELAFLITLVGAAIPLASAHGEQGAAVAAALASLAGCGALAVALWRLRGAMRQSDASHVGELQPRGQVGAPEPGL